VIDRNGIRPGSWQAVAWHAREFIREYWRALVIPLVILTLIVAAAIRLDPLWEPYRNLKLGDPGVELHCVDKPAPARGAMGGLQCFLIKHPEPSD
jgi:hypothetical protein